jgi:pentatricopeptide repeat protein
MQNAGIVASSATYNTLIKFLCKFGCVQEAKELMMMMVLRGVLPDNITYRTLVINFDKNCIAEEVIELHDSMVLKGVVPDKLTYENIVSPLLQEESATS